jgi:hypothetical protein
MFTLTIASALLSVVMFRYSRITFLYIIVRYKWSKE